MPAKLALRHLLQRPRFAQRNVWIRVTAVDSRTSQVDVQARGSWGNSDLDLVHEIEKEIALQLAR